MPMTTVEAAQVLEELATAVRTIMDAYVQADAERTALRAERDQLLTEQAALGNRIQELSDQAEALVAQINGGATP